MRIQTSSSPSHRTGKTKAVREGVQLSEALCGDGAAIFRHACAMGLEGIVSKRVGSRYVSGRTRAWLKTRTRISRGSDSPLATDQSETRNHCGKIMLPHDDRGRGHEMGKVEAVPRELAIDGQRIDHGQRINKGAAKVVAQRLRRAYRPVTDARPDFDRVLSDLEQRLAEGRKD